MYANKFHCLEEALTVVAFLSSESVFLSTSNDFLSYGGKGVTSSDKKYQIGEENSSLLRQFDAAEGDHVRMLKIYRTYRTQLKNNKNNLIVNVFVRQSLRHINRFSLGLVHNKWFTCSSLGEYNSR